MLLNSYSEPLRLLYRSNAAALLGKDRPDRAERGKSGGSCVQARCLLQEAGCVTHVCASQLRVVQFCLTNIRMLYSKSTAALQKRFLIHLFRELLC